MAAFSTFHCASTICSLYRDSADLYRNKLYLDGRHCRCATERFFKLTKPLIASNWPSERSESGKANRVHRTCGYNNENIIRLYWKVEKTYWNTLQTKIFSMGKVVDTCMYAQFKINTVLGRDVRWQCRAEEIHPIYKYSVRDCRGRDRHVRHCPVIVFVVHPYYFNWIWSGILNYLVLDSSNLAAIDLREIAIWDIVRPPNKPY